MKKRLFIFFAVLYLVNVNYAQTLLTEAFDTHSIQHNSPQRDYTIVKSIYSADAQKLSSEWISSDFSLDKQGRYSTGQYSSNTSLSTRSSSIALPALEDNQKIILQLKGSLQTEYIFDPVIISVSANGGENFKKIAIKSGRNVDWNEDFDLSEFAEKNVIISLNLISDEIHEKEGLSLDSTYIVVASYLPSFSLRSGNLENNLPRLVRTPLTRDFDIYCVDAGRGGVRIGVNIENINQQNVEVYAYLAQGNGDFIQIEAALSQYNDFFDEYGYYVTVPPSYVTAPHFRYYFEAKIRDIDSTERVINNPPLEYPHRSKTVAVCGSDQILNAFNNNLELGFGPCGIAPGMCPIDSYDSDNIKICHFFYRKQGSLEAYACVNMMKSESYGKKCFKAGIATNMLLHEGIEYYYYAEDNHGTQFVAYSYENPGILPRINWSLRPAIFVYDDQENWLESGIAVDHYLAHYNKPLKKTYIIINGECSYLDLLVSNITSSNNHFSISQVNNVTIPGAIGLYVDSSYSNFEYHKHIFEITYDAKEDAVSTITINNSSANYPNYTFTVIGTVSYSECPVVTLSSNPITSRSHTLSFTLSESSQTMIYLVDESGNKINTIPYILNKTLEAGKHVVSLESLFNYNLNPLNPYILVIETAQEVSLTYLYISKL